MKRSSRIVKNTIYLTLQTVFVLFVSLYTSRVILKALGVSDFGIYNVVGGFVSMFAFLNTSMINGIQRFYNYELGKCGNEGLTRVFNTALSIQALIAIIILFLTETVGLWYINNVMVIPEERLFAAKWIFQFSVISLIFVIMQVPYSSAIVAHENMGFYSIINMLDTVLKLTIAISLPFFSADKLIVYGFLILLISIINWLLFYSYAKIKYKEIRICRGFNLSQFKEMLSFSGWNLFGSFSGVMKEQGINMILNLFFGPVVNAARGIAYQVNGAMMGFVANINTASRPQLTQSYASGNLDRSIHLMYSMSKIAVVTITLFAVPVIFEIDYILKIWLDTEIPLHTNSFVQLVVINSIILCLNPPVSFLVHATGKMRKYQVVSSLFSLLVLPFSYIMLQQGAEPEYVFVLMILFTFIGQWICIHILKQLVDFSAADYVKQVILPLAVFLALIPILPLIPRLLLDESFFRLVLVSALSVISTGAIGYFLLLDQSEKDRVLLFLKIKKNE